MWKHSKLRYYILNAIWNMFENGMYLDNPGLRQTVDKETWNAWKRKGLIRK